MQPSITALIDQAIQAYGHETPRLRCLPENRYNRKLFPRQGQYDWFSGQVLYCLVRLVKPEQVVEISCADGYSSLFIALALQENGSGLLETFELSAPRAARARENFRSCGVESCVRIHVGDVRRTVEQVPMQNTRVLFLDSLHSAAFARWYLKELVSPLENERLVHVHDIMPRHARVRHFNGPPFRGGWTVSWAYRTYVRFFRPGMFQHVQIPATAIHENHGRSAYDGNHFEEAYLINALVEQMALEDYAYLYELADRYPQLRPRDYDRWAVGRKDSQGRRMEWNEALWCYAGPLGEAYRESTGKESASGTAGVRA